MKSKKIAFVGGGNMASSLIGGLVADGYDPKFISVCEPDAAKRDYLKSHFGVQTSDDNAHTAAEADVVVLAVKPQVMEPVATELAPVIRANTLVVSIAAGVRERSLKKWIGANTAVVRTMPNTPAMIQAGAIALHASPEVSEAQKDLAESIMRAGGLTLWLDSETQLDAVTALSGSGPAYFFRVMEAMEAAGEEMGLSAEDARLLTLQTALGAARMAMESKDPPAILRKKVTSPGGTTERALGVMEEGDLGGLFMRALKAAQARSEELSEALGNDR